MQDYLSEEKTQALTMQVTGSGPLGLVWIDCPYPVVAVGLAKILEKEAWVHVGQEAPAGESPSSIILGANRVEEALSESVKRPQGANPDAPVLVFGLQPALPLA